MRQTLAYIFVTRDRGATKMQPRVVRTGTTRGCIFHTWLHLYGRPNRRAYILCKLDRYPRPVVAFCEVRTSYPLSSSLPQSSIPLRHDNTSYPKGKDPTNNVRPRNHTPSSLRRHLCSRECRRPRKPPEARQDSIVGMKQNQLSVAISCPVSQPKQSRTLTISSPQTAR